MDPDDLVIIDYPSMFKPPAPPTANLPINSKESNPSTDDPLKLNQAWEREVKDRNDFFEMLVEMQRKWEKYSGIRSVPGFSAKSFVIKADIQPIQKTPHKV